MAGVDKEFEGEARPMPGIRVYPNPVDGRKTIQDTVEETWVPSKRRRKS